MERDDVLRLISDLESDRVERTVSSTNTDKFAEAICAFANDMPKHRLPGYLLIGLQDDGTPSGLVGTDWDARSCLAATLDDLALDLFAVGYRLFAVAPEVIAENHRSLTEQLAALRFYDLSPPANGAFRETFSPFFVASINWPKMSPRPALWLRKGSPSRWSMTIRLVLCTNSSSMRSFTATMMGRALRS